MGFAVSGRRALGTPGTRMRVRGQNGSFGLSQCSFKVLRIGIRVIDEDDYRLRQSTCQPNGTLSEDVRRVHTMFGDVEPDTVLVKGILIRVEALQRATSGGGIAQILVHRGILLMAKDDPLAGATDPAAFTTLRAFGFLLVT